MRHHLDATLTPLTSGWRTATTPASAVSTPGQLPASLAFVPAEVPGTLAAALAAAGRFDPDDPVPLHDLDAWYLCDIASSPGPAVLRFEGLATIAEVFLNDALVLRSESMFEASDVPVELTGDDTLAIRFCALTGALAAKGPRARWRPRLADTQGLRLVRTTLLGHMPGWCPSIHAVGPYRPVSLIRPGRLSLDDVRIHSDLDGTDGLLTVSFAGPAEGLLLRCGGVDAAFANQGDRAGASLRIPDVRPWWPGTHGEPALYDIEVVADGRVHHLARTGFRHLEIDQDAGDFAIRVNGVPIFCRGAVWTSADVLGLSGTREACEPLLRQAADAGMNMIRVPGIATYESAAFYELCDELGLLVFADLMFANFDYPAADPTFAAHVDSEVRQFLDARQGCPSLAVVCAGSEIAQQAAMLGLPQDLWYSTLATGTLPALVHEWRPDVTYVPGSPSGGALPFSVDAGVGHYYGVGAYLRPLEDARRAAVVFAAECLAFANVADGGPAPDDPLWAAGVPRDPGTSWDFADVRDHYLRVLYDHDPDALRDADPDAYLSFSRAATAEVVTETFAEWRRTGSSCRGALVFTLADVRKGPGWGVLDHTHRPKAIFRALARAFAPIVIGITDEGVNGLHLHLANETAAPVAASVELLGLRDGVVPVARTSGEVRLAPREQRTLPATHLLGSFFDYGYAYRFGPPEAHVVLARLLLDDEVVSEAWHFPLGRSAALFDATLAARALSTGSGWSVEVSADAVAQSVHLDVPGWEPGDDWFHLSPDRPRRIALRPLPGTDPAATPRGWVGSLGGSRCELRAQE